MVSRAYCYTKDLVLKVTQDSFSLDGKEAMIHIMPKVKHSANGIQGLLILYN